jgi:hypothetical protein
MTMKYIIATLAATAGMTFGIPCIAHADPVRCRDLPGTFGTSHVCQNADGSVTNCISSALPIVGPPCQPVYAALAPGFWDQP